MKHGRERTSIALAASIMLAGSCLGIQVPFLPLGNSGSPAPAVLSRCGPNPSALCLLSFGIEPPYKMLITFVVPPDSPSAFYVRVTYGETRALYQCLVVKDIPTSHYCAGAQIPLGTSIGVEVLATQGNALLARGDFVLNGLAFPTPPGGGASSSTSAAPTALNSLAPRTPTASLSVPFTLTSGAVGTRYPYP